MNKKNIFRLGIGLTVIGLIITLVGFTMAGWQMDKYHEEAPISWYRTVRFN
ncbi:hypothetical protein RV06_GL000885 [Enterococcus haemoperoxidus]|nr:hypothetical protein RV06_GL000885 [Enterococcus haemoperoxidus]